MMLNPAPAAKNPAYFHTQSASLVLMLLLCADLIFLVLHSIRIYMPFLENSLFSIDVDGSYSELYQYLKWLWITLLFTGLSKSKGSLGYCSWALVFAFMLCDDIFRIHEKAGYGLAKSLSFAPALGFRMQDFGELAVWCAAGLILFLTVALAYKTGTPAFRRISRDIVLLLSGLFFFGVVVDMAHIALHPGRSADLVLTLLEDGGEMIMASLILWYVFLRLVHGENQAFSFFDEWYSRFRRHSA
ncbi:hypothetical protein JW948_17835 [bacterium]|nr:hypothetical protein [bacterium]